mmetsp:Transcript_14773/g.18608  ORF Transcript_14773/g.18608 Transcript_14773/m.18608 type:complete len:206 (-) Transcript_14773:89-706(-)
MSELYRARNLRRVVNSEQSSEEDALESPEMRKTRLLNSFKKKRVTMVIKEDDFVEPYSTWEKDNNMNAANIAIVSSHSDEMIPNDHDNTYDTLNRPPSSLQLAFHLDNPNNDRDHDTIQRRGVVPNCCAVCLCTYNIGDTVVWSSNYPKCRHAFHESCITEWFVKIRKGTPCPCCRQEFTDLECQHVSVEKRQSGSSIEQVVEEV